MEIIFEMCKHLINIDKLDPTIMICCIDGTSSTFKSTILDKLQNISTFNISKIQHRFTIINPNTNPSSGLGYIYAGMQQIQESNNTVTFNDRSYLNTFEWNCIIWPLIEIYVSRFGYKSISELHDYEFDDYLKVFKTWIVEFKSFFPYCMYRKKINTIVLINSNVKKVDELRLHRNIGSDSLRSQWPFYTWIQNIFYKLMYDDLCIDLSHFPNDLSNDNIVDGLTKFFIYVGNYLQTTNTQIQTIDAQQKRKKRYAKIPILFDYTKANISAYVFRHCKKAEIKGIINNEISKQSHLNQHIPKDIIFYKS